MDKIKKIPAKKLLEMINSVKDRVKDSDVLKKLFKEYDVDSDYIYLIPMSFADLDVSATTDHGCIYFSYKLLEDGDFEKDDHYMVHEIVHHFQQTFRTHPTGGSDEDSYLDDKDEQEGFANQSEFIEEEHGEAAAEKYIDKVLDHHDIKNKKERDERKEQLMDRKAQLQQYIKL